MNNILKYYETEVLFVTEVGLGFDKFHDSIWFWFTSVQIDSMLFCIYCISDTIHG